MDYQELDKKLDEYAGKIRESYEKENFDEALQRIKEYDVFLTGLESSGANLPTANWYSTLRATLTNYRRLVLLAKQLKQKTDEDQVKFNCLTLDLNNIKKRLEAIEKGV